MIDASAIAEIIATYQKYGWILRRVLLSPTQMKQLGKDKDTLFVDAEVAESVIDAAWFSRPPTGGGVAWEIRYFGDIPYAVLEQADENDPKFENILRGAEARLRDYVAMKQTA